MKSPPITLMDAVNRLRGFSRAMAREWGERSRYPLMRIAAQIRFTDPDLWKDLCARCLAAERRNVAHFKDGSMKKVSLVLVALALVLSSACTTLLAQSLPLTVTIAWNASATADDYVVSLDGVVVGLTTDTTALVKVANAGAHVVTVVARNQSGSSMPASLTLPLMVPVGKSGKVRLK